jgi:hypothetical protein
MNMHVHKTRNSHTPLHVNDLFEIFYICLMCITLCCTSFSYSHYNSPSYCNLIIIKKSEGGRGEWERIDDEGKERHRALRGGEEGKED